MDETTERILKRLKSHYEYSDEDFTDVAEEYNLAIEDVRQFATEQGWEPKAPPEMSQEAIGTFYLDARREMSARAIARAVIVTDRVNEIEDNLLAIVTKAVKDMKRLQSKYVNSMDVVRYSKVLDNIKEGNIIWKAALEVPANADPDRTPTDAEEERKFILEVVKAVKGEDKET